MSEIIQNQIYTFSCGGSVWAVPVSVISEALHRSDIGDITPVFHTDDSSLGYVNVRGEIYLICDIAKKLTGNACSSNDCDIILFKENEDGALGIAVDRALKIIAVDEENLEEWNPSEDCSDREKLYSGIYKDGKQLISIIDPGNIL